MARRPGVFQRCIGCPRWLESYLSVAAIQPQTLQAHLDGGMPATNAQALMRGLITQDADPAADAEALERLEPHADA
jgi:hypothetical protein